jgi:hypothetical protein
MELERFTFPSYSAVFLKMTTTVLTPCLLDFVTIPMIFYDSFFMNNDNQSNAITLPKCCKYGGIKNNGALASAVIIVE